MRHVLAIVMPLLIVSGCVRPPTTVGPKTGEMVGHYTTKDSRAANTTLDLLVDGTFTLSNWPGTNGSGTWKVEQDEITKMWDLNLVFTPQNYYQSGNQVLGGPGNYSLGFFLNNGDEEAVVLEKKKP